MLVSACTTRRTRRNQISLFHSTSLSCSPLSMISSAANFTQVASHVHQALILFPVSASAWLCAEGTEDESAQMIPPRTVVFPKQVSCLSDTLKLRREGAQSTGHPAGELRDAALRGGAPCGSHLLSSFERMPAKYLSFCVLLRVEKDDVAFRKEEAEHEAAPDAKMAKTTTAAVSLPRALT